MDGDWTSAFELADVEPGDLLEHFERAWFRGREYRYLTDARHGVERGTALVGDTVVRGYPSIPRALVLETSVPAQFDGPVTIEEKLNGYNARVARIDGDLLGFTRRGYICPYTTAHVEEALADTDVLEAHPEWVLCGELVGPENPYTTHDYAEVDSAGFYVFDIRDRVSGTPLAPERRRAVCDEYGLDAVTHFGTADPDAAAQRVHEVIADLDARGREGVVLKSADGQQALKYTTSAIHRADLEHAFSLLFDYGRDFIFTRVIREAFQAVEHEEDPETVRERARDMGEAILQPAVETIRAVERDDLVGESHTVRADPAVVASLLSYFRDRGLELDIERDERIDGERVVTFTKVARATQDKTKYYLEGGTVDE